jgi:tetratricopeptide (TPR) repeat protein
VFLKQNRLPEALETAKLGTHNQFKGFDNWVVLGNIYQALENWQNAINSYLVAIRYSPFAPDILGDLSICYQKVSEYDKAYSIAKKRSILDPKNPNVWIDLNTISKILNLKKFR